MLEPLPTTVDDADHPADRRPATPGRPPPMATPAHVEGGRAPGAGRHRPVQRLPDLLDVRHRPAADRQGVPADTGAIARVAAQPPLRTRHPPGQVLTRVAQPPGFRAMAEQGLCDGEADEFGVGQPWRSAQPPGPTGPCDPIIDLYVQCGQEGVQVCRHTPILGTLSACPHLDPDFGLTRLLSSAISP